MVSSFSNYLRHHIVKVLNTVVVDVDTHFEHLHGLL